jgi:phosphatidylinositol-3,4,5-trisphosphate 3-phosphatase/dual-specificity protein phosphatase PTEN
LKEHGIAYKKKATLGAQDFAMFRDLLAKHDPQKLPEVAVVKNPKHLVSQKKKRFKNEKFDLDLAYITERIIAMGYPSTGYEKIYRNQMEDVQAFLKEYHHQHYKVYNLCSERNYPPSKFLNFSAFPFDDHNVPPIEKIYAFCEDASAWLDQNSKNVVAVHCKAGKGRTGMMICALLAYKYPEKLDIDTAFNFYGSRRTLDGKGVTIPSQVRFSQYFISVSQSFKDGTWNNEREAYKELVSIQISNLPKIFSVWLMTTTVIDEKTKKYELDRELMKNYIVTR